MLRSIKKSPSLLTSTVDDEHAASLLVPLGDHVDHVALEVRLLATDLQTLKDRRVLRAEVAYPLDLWPKIKHIIHVRSYY